LEPYPSNLGEKMNKVKALLIFVAAIGLSGCGASGKTSGEETLPVKITQAEIANLKVDLPKLNVNEDGFTDSITYSSTPSNKCSGHNFWFVVKTDMEGRGASAYLFASSVDDINDNIGNPSKLTSLTGSERRIFAKDTGENLNNTSCAGSAWAYPSKFWISGSDVDSLIASLEDESSQYRLSADTNMSGYRDVSLSDSQRTANLAVLRIVKGFWEQGLTPSDLK
jgi:hypothetical protein